MGFAYPELTLSSSEEEPAAEKVLYVVNQAEQPEKVHHHPWWDHRQGWKNLLNNLRLIIQPYVYHCLLYG
jgi:hypothetical protein